MEVKKAPPGVNRGGAFLWGFKTDLYLLLGLYFWWSINFLCSKKLISCIQLH